MEPDIHFKIKMEVKLNVHWNLTSKNFVKSTEILYSMRPHMEVRDHFRKHRRFHVFNASYYSVAYT